MKLFKRRSHTLYLMSQGVIALTHENGITRVSARFDDPDVEAQDRTPGAAPESEFRQWVQEHQSDSFTLLIDHVDEQQLVEELPRLGRRDRNALIQKRISTRFRDSEFFAHRAIDRPGIGKTTTNRTTMMALKVTVSISPWLDTLLAERARIRLMTSPSMLSWPLIRQFAPGETGLIVSSNPAGLRQSLVVNGSVRFSRLSRLNSFDASQIRDEIQRSVEYLIMTQRLTRSDLTTRGFVVWLITDGIEGIETMPASLPLDMGAAVTIKLLNAASLGLSTVENAPALSVWAGASERSRGTLTYANDRVTKFETLAHWRRRLWISAASIAVAGVVMIGSVDILVDQQLPDMRKVQTTTDKLQNEIRRLESVVATYPASPQDMLSSVGLVDRLRQNEVDPLNLFSSLASAWQGGHGLTITEISFGPAKPANAGTSMTGSAKAIDAGGDLLRGNLTITLSGQLDPSLTRTTANQKIDELAARLLIHCECVVDDIELPYDRSTTSGLTGKVSDGNQKPSRFKVTMGRYNESLAMLQNTAAMTSPQDGTLDSIPPGMLESLNEEPK